MDLVRPGIAVRISLTMRNLGTWIDWFVLALCMVAAAGAMAYGINALGARATTPLVEGRPFSDALAVIATLTVINCGFLVGAAVCQVRRDVRPRRR